MRRQRRSPIPPPDGQYTHYLVRLTNANSIPRTGRKKLPKHLWRARLLLHSVSPAVIKNSTSGRRVRELQAERVDYREILFNTLPSRCLAKLKKLAPSLVKGQTDEFKIIHQYKKHGSKTRLPPKAFYRLVVRIAKYFLVRGDDRRSLNAFFADLGYGRGDVIRSDVLAREISNWLGGQVNITRNSYNQLSEIKILIDLNHRVTDHVGNEGLDDVMISF